MSDTLWNLFYADVQTTCDRDEHSTRFVRWRKQRLRKDWKHFCEIMQCPRDDVNLDEPTGARELWTPPPPLNQDYLRRDITSLTGFDYSPVEKKEVKFFIEKELWEAEGLSTKARKKALADLPVIEDVLDFLWQRDEFVYKHPRIRIQIATGILCIWYMGVRTGEFTENACSLPNEGLLWKDFNISLIYDSSPTFHIQVQLRNRKGRRGKESAFQTENLREEKDRWRCPLTLILALAIEDKALKGIDTVEDLRTLGFHEHQTKMDLRIRCEMREIPVLRRTQQGGCGISKDAILRGTTFAQLLSDLGARAGYVDALVPYNIRRGFGNRLDKELTEAERCRQIGHQNSSTFQYYLSQAAPCDVQAIMNGHAADQEKVDFLRSMRSNIDRTAPKQRQSSLTEPRSRRHD
ncbi:unnamed protein product [Zymoseptoria tritici ST99CH_3D1]|nr:unnamed protein product [Zymoseptoria tritici ST99CH_3D1]